MHVVVYAEMKTSLCRCHIRAVTLDPGQTPDLRTDFQHTSDILRTLPESPRSNSEPLRGPHRASELRTLTTACQPPWTWSRSGLRPMVQLRLTPDLVRTIAHLLAFSSDFRAACQAADPSLTHSVTSLCYSGSPPAYGTLHTPSRSSGSGLQYWVSLRWTPL
jgi:hypothetical protein